MPPLCLPPLFAAVALGALMLSSNWVPSSAEPVDSVVHATPWPSASPGDPYAAFVSEASRRFGMPESWIRAVIRVESAGDHGATSPDGAMGLMQVMPQTWAELRARYGFGPNAYDPHDSILAGTAYLREMHDRYGTVEGMLAAYNAGPGRYDEYLTTGRQLPWETQNYLAMIAPIIGGTAPPLSPSRQVDRTFDVFAAPVFVARTADPGDSVVQIPAVPAAALTADEARLIAAQSARTLNASELKPSSETGGLFVPRSQSESHP